MTFPDGVVEIVIDCETQEEIVAPASEETLADMQALRNAAQVAADEQAAADDKRDQAMQVVADKATTDPAFAALATLLGLDI